MALRYLTIVVTPLTLLTPVTHLGYYEQYQRPENTGQNTRGHSKLCGNDSFIVNSGCLILLPRLCGF